MGRKISRETYLERSADMLCRAAYQLCRESFRGRRNGDPVDAKHLKDIAAAVKESVNVSESLGKRDEAAARFSVTVCDEAKELAE